MLRDARAWQQLDLQIVGYVQLAGIEIAAKNLVGAQSALQEAEQLAQIQGSTYYHSAVASTRVEMWLAEGNLAVASDWASHAVFDRDTWTPDRAWEFLMVAHVYLAQKRHTQAREVLERFSDLLDRPGDVNTIIHFLALHFAALQGEEKTAQALAVAERLFAITEPEGYICMYLAAGEPMKQALRGLLSIRPPQADGSYQVPALYVQKLLAAFEQEERNERGEHMVSQLSSVPPPSPPPPRPGSTPTSLPMLARQSPAEPLTRREEEILRLLMAGASNQEIAAQLVISLPTVKKHVSNLLGKLGVERRAQAVARAREWSLLA